MRKFIQLMMISCACLIVASCSREATIAGTAEKIRELALYSCSKGEITLLDTVKNIEALQVDLVEIRSGGDVLKPVIDFFARRRKRMTPSSGAGK